MLRKRRIQNKSRELLELIETRRTECRESRRPDIGRWYEALAFYRGKQWVKWNERGRRLDDLVAESRKKDPTRVHITINKIYPAVRQLVGLFLRNRRGWETIPAQADEEDRDRARAAQEILEWYATDPRVGLSGKLRDFVTWAIVCGGGGIIKALWNPELSYYGDKGDIEFEVVPPFRIYWDLTKTNPQDSTWLIEEMLLDEDYCLRRWPDKEELIEPDGKGARDSENGQFPFKQDFLSDKDVLAGSESLLRDKVTVRLMWEKPSREHEQGRAVFATKLGELETKPMFPLYRQFPYFRVVYMPRLTSGVSGLSPVEQATQPQMLYNRLVSQMTENNNAMLYYWWAISVDANVNAKEIENRAGRVIYYEGQILPQIITPPPIAHQIWQQMADLERSIQDIFALHDPMMGIAPPNIESGRGVEALQDKDMSAQAPILQEYEAALVQLGQHILHLVRERWTGKRLIRILGDSHRWEAREYSRKDVMPNTDVRLKAQTDMPDSRAAKREFMERFAQYKMPEMLRADPEFRLFFYRNMNMGASGEEFFHEQRIQENKAKEESEQILTNPDTLIKDPRTGFIVGSTVQVTAFDDDLAHIAQHRRDAHTEMYRNASRDMQQALQVHNIAHQAKHMSNTAPDQMAAMYQMGIQQQRLLQDIQAGKVPQQQTNLQSGAAGAGQPQPPAQPAAPPTSMVGPQGVPGGGQPPPANPLT